MVSSFLIGLREGLEAALVVGILVAYLVRTGRRDRLAPVWAGVGIAVTLSVLLAGVLAFTSNELSDGAQEAFAGIVSVVAVGFVTWMIFWMRAQARELRHELHSRLAEAVAGGAITVAVMAFLAVVREGLETAIFFWSNMQAVGEGAGPVIGVVAGVAVAVLAGWGVYRGSVHLNLATFFTITGAALIIVAAGVLSYGIHELQEAGLLFGGGAVAFDVSGAIPPSGWLASLLKGVFGFTPETTWLQVVAWVGYVGTVMTLFFLPAGGAARGRSQAPAAEAPVS